MAVYRRRYQQYEGALTEPRWRFTILPRYAFRNVFESKLLTAFFALCGLPHLVALVLIYVRHNLAALQTVLPGPVTELQFLFIDGNFFLVIFIVESFLSFFLASFIGPGLVSPDLANNALPLYLSRPFSRGEYVLGKLAILVSFISLITWVPGLLLVVVQTTFDGPAWVWANIRIVIGIFVGSWIWMLTISFLSLAISAWVRFKPVATASLFGVFFIGAAFGSAINETLELQTKWGVLLDMANTMRMLWRWLLLGDTFFRGVPAWSGVLSMAGVCVFSLLLLRKKIRACEVVR